MSRNYDETKIRAAYNKLTNYLIRSEKTITTMESATSGLIASLITDTEGASAILKGAFITYSNEAKMMQGVPAEIIEKYSVYSKETAISMAENCRSSYGADIGIGVTGTMGNIDPENAGNSELGIVYFAIAQKSKTESYQVKISPQRSRYQYKLAVAQEIYDALNVIFYIDEKMTGEDEFDE